MIPTIDVKQRLKELLVSYYGHEFQHGTDGLDVDDIFDYFFMLDPSHIPELRTLWLSLKADKRRKGT